MKARPAYDFVNSVGVNTHFSWTGTSYDTRYEQLKTALADIGIKHIRQSAAGTASVKRITDLYKSLGVLTLMLVDNFGAADWTARDLPPAIAATQVNDAIAKLGAGVFSGIEGPNEYEAVIKKGVKDWALKLRTFQAALYAAVKGNDAAAGIPVVAPSLIKNTAANFRELGNVSSFCDLGNLHAYCGEPPMDAGLAAMMRLTPIVTPGKQVLVTEYGLHTAMKEAPAHPFSDNAKAKYMARAVAALFAHSEVRRGYIYDLIDAKSEPDNPGYNFGLIHADGTPTKAYYAIRNLMHMLCDADATFEPRELRTTITGDVRKVRSFLVQKASGVFYLVLWQDAICYEKPKLSNKYVCRDWDSAMVPVTIVFDEPIAKVRTYIPRPIDGDPDSGKRATATFDAPTSVGLDVPDELLVVEIVPGCMIPVEFPGCKFTATA